MIRDLCFMELNPQGPLIIKDGFLPQEVDDPPEILFLTDRELQGHGVGTQAFLHHFHYSGEIRPYAVHLVHESNPWDAIFIRLSPNGFTLGLDAADCAED